MTTTLINHTKIAIIGAGAVGSTAAYAAAIKNLGAEIMLIDVNEQIEEGQVMDIRNGMCYMDTGCIKGGDFVDAKDADIIVITAGAAQKPGETRLDLVNKNAGILKSIFKNIGKIKSTAIILMIANPVDVLTTLALKISGLSENQVFGSGTTLDTARLRMHLGNFFHVSPQSVHGYVMGEHGDSEFVAWSTVTVGGVPVNKIPGFKAEDAKKLEQAVKKEVYEIINRKGATYYGIGLVIADILEAIIYNQHRILPITSMLKNWNGVSGVCLGSPAVVGRNGREKLWPVTLNSKEKKTFNNCAETIKTFINKI